MNTVKHTMRGAMMFAILLFGMGAGGDASDSSGPLAVIREFGFPVFVALWFMWRVEKRMDRFTDVVQNLLTTVTVMAKTIDGLPAHGRPPTHPPEAA